MEAATNRRDEGNPITMSDCDYINQRHAQDKSSRISATSWEHYVSFPFESMQSCVLRILFILFQHNPRRWEVGELCYLSSRLSCANDASSMRYMHYVHPLEIFKNTTTRASTSHQIFSGSRAIGAQGLLNGQEFTRSKVESHWGEWWMPL